MIWAALARSGWRPTLKQPTLTVIQDLLTGQYQDPVRIIAFNTSERWSQDASEDVAHEFRRLRSAAARRPVVCRNSSNGMKAVTGQLALRLVRKPKTSTMTDKGTMNTCVGAADDPRHAPHFPSAYGKTTRMK
jgi:hypothetical protein